MRIPIPERFNLRPAVLFGLFLFLGQQVAGTDIVFSVLTLTYFALFVTGFNLAGGLLYPSGGFIFFNGVLTALFGLTYKVFLMEPGEKTLLSGNKTMLVYCGGMFSMAAAAALSRRLRPQRGLLGSSAGGKAMHRSAIGLLIAGCILTVAGFNGEEGSLASALRQINHFIQMSIVFATMYEFRRSGGKKSANWVVYTGIAIMSAQGLVAFSKEGMFMAPITWLITVVALGYNFSSKQVLAYAAAAAFVVFYLVPYSQYVRTFRGESLKEDIGTAVKYLGDLPETRRLYLNSMEESRPVDEPHLYSTPQGFFDRLTMLAFDDHLINYTDQGHVFGLLPTFYSYSNIVPHVFWKDKPFFAYGNVYAREIGALPPEDVTTGISFSPTGDAYHEATWFGVLVVWFVNIFLFFFITDSLTGSVRDAPWGLLPIILASHQAPEGLMSGTIYLSTYGVVALLFTAWFAKYLIPMANDLLRGNRHSPVTSAAGLEAKIPVARRL